MLNWLNRLFGKPQRSRKRHRQRQEEPPRRNPPAEIPPIRSAQPSTPASDLRAVPGALVAKSHTGQVAYNMLTPHMGQFMGRCVGGIKRAGLSATGTGQFSILVGEQSRELRLDRFYQPSDDPKVIEQVVAEARRIANGA
jgi:hypothetical protein